MTDTLITRRQCVGALAALTLPLLGRVPMEAATRQWRVTGYDVPELRSFDHAIEQFMRSRNIRSGALAVARGGRLLLARGYSWDDRPGDVVQPTSLFRIASVSKPLTAATVLRLAGEAGVEPSAPVASLLGLQARDPRFAEITLLHLLQHLGGWDRSRTFDPVFHDAAINRALRASWPVQQHHIVSFMAGQPVDYPPGLAYFYSNFGYLLLGRVVERLSGLGYEAAVRRTLLNPLGIGRMRVGRSLAALRAEGEVSYDSSRSVTTVMDGSGRKVPEPYGGFNLENLDSAGAWVASPVDLVRFAAALGSPDPSVLDAPLIERMFAPPAIGPQADGAYYGCGWLVRPVNDGRNTVHSGTLPGTSASLVRRWDGVDWAVVFNQRDEQASSKYIVDIDNSLGLAANGVQHWPTHDLFAEYLTALSGTG